MSKASLEEQLARISKQLSDILQSINKVNSTLKNAELKLYGKINELKKEGK